ncbi:MAG: aspartate dehydrogenase domain-containing protein [Candidatus Omnitrophota bacterium]
MTSKNGKIRLGIIGCGAIGSRIALSTKEELKRKFTLTALYDIDNSKAQILSRRFSSPVKVTASLNHLIGCCDVVVEAVNTSATCEIVKCALKAGKSVMAMSVGRLLENDSLLSLADRSKGDLLLPSGAIAGIDAVKAAAVLGIKTMILTSTKPCSGFTNNVYVLKRRLLEGGIQKDVVLFDGHVRDAVKYFPQNINVAATLALAAGKKVNFRVRVIASSTIKRNRHEIVLEGKFGCIRTTSENTICPDNPKTSYLAVLSGIRTLQGFATHVKVGT